MTQQKKGLQQHFSTCKNSLSGCDDVTTCSLPQDPVNDRWRVNWKGKCQYVSLDSYVQEGWGCLLTRANISTVKVKALKVSPNTSSFPMLPLVKPS